MAQYSAEPPAWGTRVSLPHLASHSSWVGTGAALARRGTEQTTTHPVRCEGKPALELASGRDVASVLLTTALLCPHKLRGSGRNPPLRRRAGGSDLGSPCGGTVPALNVNVGSFAEQTPREGLVLQGRGRGEALQAHQVTALTSRGSTAPRKPNQLLGSQ